MKKEALIFARLMVSVEFLGGAGMARSVEMWVWVEMNNALICFCIGFLICKTYLYQRCSNYSLFICRKLKTLKC